MFEQNSRYYHLDDLTYTDDQGKKIIYKSRRILPQSENVKSLVNTTVKNGQRLDQISNSMLGNSAYYWKLGDANASFSLLNLEKPGTVLRIPSEGSGQG
jgi:nucleoid-associated protein YgaU